MIPVLLFLKPVCFVECTGITFVDSTKIAVCNNKRIKRNKVFKDPAAVGKSTMGWFFGFKPHLICNDRGNCRIFALPEEMWTRRIAFSTKNLPSGLNVNFQPDNRLSPIETTGHF
jgi:hypothetical protein